MAKVTDQNIPAELLDAWGATLGTTYISEVSDYVHKRYPWILDRMKGSVVFGECIDCGPGVTVTQLQVRAKFKLCCNCYNLQDPTHEVKDPPTGPKSRGYWYEEAKSSGLWYYCYFMQQTINMYLADEIPGWCKIVCEASRVEERNPNQNFYYSGFVWCMNQSTQKRMVGLVKKANPDTSILHIYVTVVDISAPAGYAKIDVDIYEIEEDWDGETVTWNTRPTKGKYLTTLTLERDGYPWPRWEKVEIKEDVVGLYIIPRDTDPWMEGYAITFNSWVVAAEPYNPFFT